MRTSTVSPAFMGPMPDGVPVVGTSRGGSGMTGDTHEICRAIETMTSEVGADCTRAPFR
jgi:hypothetical protein